MVLIYWIEDKWLKQINQWTSYQGKPP